MASNIYTCPVTSGGSPVGTPATLSPTWVTLYHLSAGTYQLGGTYVAGDEVPNTASDTKPAKPTITLHITNSHVDSIYFAWDAEADGELVGWVDLGSDLVNSLERYMYVAIYKAPVITTLASNAITASVLAANAITGNTLATSAITKIQSGLWDVLTSTFNTVGSIGKLIKDNLNATVSGIADAVWTRNTRTVDTATALGSGAVSGIADAVWTRNTRTVDTATTLGANTITGIADAVWAHTTRSLDSTAVSGIVSSVWSYNGRNIDSLSSVATNAITAASFSTDSITARALAADADVELANAVADVVGTGGGDTGGPTTLTDATLSAIADSVWDELRAQHTVEGSFGQGVASVRGNVTGTVVGNVNVGTNSDKTNYAIGEASITAIADAVAGQAIAGHSVSTIGGAIADIQNSINNTSMVYTVDHNWGGADTYQVLGEDGITPVLGVNITAYATSDYTAGHISSPYVKGVSETGSDGRWIFPLQLRAGAYTLVFSKPGAVTESTVNITVG